MNKFIHSDTLPLPYSIYKPAEKNTDYVKIDPKDLSHIKFVLDKFINHVYDKQKFTAQKGPEFYHEIYVVPRPEPLLPTPSKIRNKGRSVNTYGTFVEGVLDNFNKGTKDFSTRQFDHVIDIYNIAVDYFEHLHPDFEPAYVANKLKPVKVSKI